MIEVRALGLDGVLEIIPVRHEDIRGFFSETYNARMLGDHGVPLSFIQDNHSKSKDAGVLRGLHFQLPPFAQDKLVRVVRGKVFDVAVDIRRSSPTFGRWVGLELSAEKWNQILVPVGFAHGFVTLEPDTEVIYKVTAPYSPSHDRAIRFDDPSIGIAWPMDPHAVILSKKDLMAPFLNDMDTGF
ncbi:dTDP-4-dehydrorhamnose 3,5-epimerase [Pseudorhodoplanes sp.]|uniref:dTDP-4-dehydrorhamnose 3,5-epimerase n=1 Tax=Pseudorhodoplanes sp. TaxID=1934341 RepID=UPI003D12C0CE